MNATEVVIISHSQIITSGIKALISSLATSIPFEKVSSLTPEKSLSAIPLIDNRVIIIADVSSIDVTTIFSLRETTPRLEQIIGIYHSALPSAVASAFDATFSVYDDIHTFNRLIKNAVRSTRDELSTNSDELTPREKDIVVGVVKGLSNKEIANHLNVSVNTVMTHRRNIASKLQIHSPAGLTIYAIVSKLISIDDIKSEIV